MREADGTYLFGEWLPDLPDYENPGMIEAKNVVPTDKVYKSFLPISGTGDALAARPLGASSAFDSTGAGFFYAGTAAQLYQRSGSGWTLRTGATTINSTSGNYWRFAQFDNTLIGTNYDQVPQAITVGAAGFTVLSSSGTAPSARHIGVVNRFVVLGDTNDATNGAVPARLQWSAIDNARNWPTPGSSTAVANQSGAQVLDAAFGPVRAIVGGQQYGIVLQRTGVTRMTYVGGNVVFQFDVIDRSRGALFPNATVQVGHVAYFVGGDGFYATDGNIVTSIGAGKVDNWFGDQIDTNHIERMYGAVDFANKLIYWAFPGPSNSSGRPNRVIIYNYEEQRWSYAEQECEVLVTGLTLAVTLDQLDTYFASIDLTTPSLDAQNWAGGNNLILGFDSSFKLGAFSGSAGTAVLTGPEVELNKGAFTYVQGVKPLVTGTSPTVTVAMGVRNSQGSAASFGSEVTPTSRTGFSDFRSNARFHRPRTTITGSFNQAIGLQFQAVKCGPV